MSLTSYRAAPPRDKSLRALREPVTKRPFQRVWARRSSRPIRLAEKATQGLKPVGCGGYVPTPIRFGKGQEAAFFDFMTADCPQNPPDRRPWPELPQKPRLCAKRLTRQTPRKRQENSKQENSKQENSKRERQRGT